MRVIRVKVRIESYYSIMGRIRSVYFDQFSFILSFSTHCAWILIGHRSVFLYLQSAWCYMHDFHRGLVEASFGFHHLQKHLGSDIFESRILLLIFVM